MTLCYYQWRIRPNMEGEKLIFCGLVLYLIVVLNMNTVSKSSTLKIICLTHNILFDN